MSVILGKVSLTKEQPKINLAKRNDFGDIKINLNWDKKNKKSGFLNSLFSSNSPIDLDLAAFVRLKNGRKEVIQALGKNLGKYSSQPFIQLSNDDLTGECEDGEWLMINGKCWDQIDEILIYTFIYDGVAKWENTNGVVNLFVPNEPPIETKIVSSDSNSSLCAIARLVNKSGTIEVERLNTFFQSQRYMDEAYGWGFSWVSGRK